MDDVVSTQNDDINKRCIGLYCAVKEITGASSFRCSQWRTNLVSRKT